MPSSDFSTSDYAALIGRLGLKRIDPLSDAANQSLNNMIGVSKKSEGKDFLDHFMERRNQSPSFNIDFKQPGINISLPKYTSDVFYEDLNRGLPQPAVERYIYHRLLDENNPYPVT